jgi:hypothetical protein
MATHSLVYLNHQISVHAADVKQVLRVYSLDVPAREKDDLKEEPIIIKLRKVRSASLCIVCGIVDHDTDDAFGRLVVLVTTEFEHGPWISSISLVACPSSYYR